MENNENMNGKSNKTIINELGSMKMNSSFYVSKYLYIYIICMDVKVIGVLSIYNIIYDTNYIHI